MKPDWMRWFAWVLVMVGAAIELLTIPVARASYRASLEVWSRTVSIYGRFTPTPDGPNYAGGLIVGSLVCAFGILLLAIRRPMPADREEEPVPDPEPIRKEGLAPYPEATAYARPPWEKP
jgi:hypothetical protein